MKRVIYNKRTGEVEPVENFESKKETIFVNGSEFFQTILVGLSSQTFALKVYGSGDAFVDGLRIDYSFVE